MGHDNFVFFFWIMTFFTFSIFFFIFHLLIDLFIFKFVFIFFLLAATDYDTEVTGWYMKKDVESRWLSIDRSLARILEQLPNLRVYEKGFNGKNGLANNDRYTWICSILKSKEAQICMSFAIFLAWDFSRFIVPLKTSAPMVHPLYSMCHELVRNVMGKVAKEELLKLNGEPVFNAKMKEIDLLDEKNLKVKTFLVFTLVLSDWGFIMTFSLLGSFSVSFLPDFKC